MNALVFRSHRGRILILAECSAILWQDTTSLDIGVGVTLHASVSANPCKMYGQVKHAIVNAYHAFVHCEYQPANQRSAMCERLHALNPFEGHGVLSANHGAFTAEFWKYAADKTVDDFEKAGRALENAGKCLTRHTGQCLSDAGKSAVHAIGHVATSAYHTAGKAFNWVYHGLKSIF